MLIFAVCAVAAVQKYQQNPVFLLSVQTKIDNGKKPLLCRRNENDTTLHVGSGDAIREERRLDKPLRMAA